MPKTRGTRRSFLHREHMASEKPRRVLPQEDQRFCGTYAIRRSLTFLKFHLSFHTSVGHVRFDESSGEELDVLPMEASSRIDMLYDKISFECFDTEAEKLSVFLAKLGVLAVELKDYFLPNLWMRRYVLQKKRLQRLGKKVTRARREASQFLDQPLMSLKEYSEGCKLSLPYEQPLAEVTSRRTLRKVLVQACEKNVSGLLLTPDSDTESDCDSYLRAMKSHLLDRIDLLFTEAYIVDKVKFSY